MVRNETILLGLDQLNNWGMMTTDAALKVTSWSRWLEINGGRRAEEVVGRNLLEVFPELVSRRLDQFYHQALAGQVIVLAQRLHNYLLAMPTLMEGAGIAHMQQSVRIVPLVENEIVVGTLTVIEDVTERVVYDAELASRARQQITVATFGQQALAGLELPDLMHEAAAAVAVKGLRVEFCAILEPVADGRRLLLRAGVGWKDGAVGQATVDAGPDTLAGQTLGCAVPVILDDLAVETRFVTSALLKEHGIVSGLSVPIVVGNHPWGVLGVYTAHRRTFTDDHLHFLQAAANILGMAIERKRLEEELQMRVEQLAETDRRKNEFLAMLAHELRNPLAPLRNALNLIRMHSPERRQALRQAHEMMERQVEYLVRLVDDLLDISRITSGKIQLQKEPADLAAIVARAIEGSRPLIEGRRHNLQVILPNEAVLVEADPVRLAQVVWNLLNNSAKYTPEGGLIHLIVERVGGGGQIPAEAIVRVRDTGMGISAIMLPRVFDMFTQMDRTLNRAEGGLGIGLTLVRRLTELHGGTVEAHSPGPGQGSEFVVRLPLLWDELTLAQLKKPAGAPTPKRPKTGHRILVVDDNRDSAESLATLLRLFGNDVRTAHDGQLALEVAAAYRPDVVLLDIGLPGLTGLEVCQRLRAATAGPQPMIAAMTGYGQEEDRQRSQAAGFNAHLVKPVDLEALQELLAQPELGGHFYQEERKGSPP